MNKVPYTHKDTIVLGDRTRPQNTIDYWFQHINAVVFTEFQHYLHGRLLDVGCNIGMASLYAATREAVTYVCGVDSCANAISDAKYYRSFTHMEDKVEYKVMDFTQDCSSLGENAYDGAFSFHTLEHIYPDDLGRFLSNLVQVCKPNAPVLISIPNDHEFGSNEHVSYFTLASIQELFEDRGFETRDLSLRSVYNGKGQTNEILTALFINGGG